MSISCTIKYPFRSGGVRLVFMALLVVLINTVCVTQALAQKRLITGRVTNEKGEPIINAAIVLKGTTQGTVTDFNGDFSISATPDDVLVVSYTGFTSQEAPVGSNATVSVRMTGGKQLEQVVVIGYGAVKKSDVTGSVTSVNEKALRETPVANLSQALQGRAAGVSIGNTSTRPGQAGRIRIRGTRSLTDAANDPLIVVDGIPFAGTMNDINTNDIQSVDILKDASATAIYGSRGANGVIMVTTRRGKTGKPQVTYSGYHGVTSVARKYQVYNAAEFINFRNISGYGATAPYLPQEQEYIKQGKSTDWQDLIYQKGRIDDHQVNVTGGGEGTQYALGLGYHDETSVIPGQRFQRYGVHGAIDQKIGSRVKVGLNTQNNFGITDGENVSLMYSMLTNSPLVPAYDSNNRVINQPAYPREDGYSPLLVNNTDNWVQQRKRIATFNSLYGEVKILEGLRYRMNAGLSYFQDNYGAFTAAVSPFNSAGATSNATVTNNNGYSYTLENLLYYDKVFAEKHKLSVVALYSLQEDRSYSSSVTAYDLVANYEQFYNMNLANGSPTVNPGSESKRDLISWMGRINYGYDDRLLLTVSGRRDGSSVLAPTHKWHNYAAAAGAWNISKESFMTSAKFLSNLKVRVGYGQTANQAISPYSTMGSLSQVRYNYGSTNAYGYFVSTLPNENLRWEYSKTLNAGIDFGFIDNRITGSIDYYRTRTEDVLLPQQVPATSGVPGTFLNNVGKTENKGFEVVLSTANIVHEGNGLNWSTDINFFLNRNKIIALQSGVTQDIGNGWYVGQPIDVIYDYKKLGIWQLNEAAEAAKYGQKPGQIKVADLNGDGKITSDSDRTIIGNFQPKFQGGLTNRIAYKGFDFTFVLYGQYGGTLISTIHQPQGYMNTFQGRRNGIKQDYWTPTNPTNEAPMPDASIGDNPLYGSTLGYFDASYLKIRTITLGYTLSDKWAKKIGGNRIHIYVSCNGVATLFSPYIKAGGVDPESTGTGFQGVQGVGTTIISRQLTVGANTPPGRTFLFGLDVSY